ncbi:heteromeric transposase endonuclease subunit TnsA [Desulfovibrio oxyclinae]|uniref:heteromeric transposase endonuclease subunit TnsA n=1 Tax=Desulfovibrio oxyclinae TaxID=63560 RepID=UPI0003628565|nr:heteromeric transposase endonuclease subunit TnsA [Desulfovibrio oxyclinae]
MARKNYSPSEATFQRWLKEGRGAGRGAAYKPWLTVRDIPSQGRSHRIFGHKSQRTHHLFSDLELAVFLILEWQTDIMEIREQFPLQQEVTKELSTKHGIAHPSIRGVPQYLSSDFLVNSSRSDIPKFALQVKYSSELAKPRVIEKLELERRYWKQKSVPWFLVTQKQVSPVVIKNIDWLYSAQRDSIPDESLVHRVSFYSYQFEKNPNMPVIGLAKMLDVNYEMPNGESLTEIRQLLAQRFFTFDIHQEIHKLTPADLALTDTKIMQEVLHVQSK